MDKSVAEFGTKYVPDNYLTIALDARKSREKKFRLLLEKKKIPDIGWEDSLIEEFINYLSSLDSNNFPNKCGLGEREARIVCELVARRHYNFGHGIGRSGDLLESQPKAAGSTLLSHLTNALLLDLIRSLGIKSTQSCFLVPMATGMTINLCFLSLRQYRSNTAKYILWSRIDQKACFKSIITGGFIPIIIETIPENNLLKYNGLQTNINEFQNQIELLKPENILCIFSTTSCFAPRLCDNIIELSKLSKKYEIPHVINNAYGLQSSYLLHQIENGQNQGRIDLFVQSTDKNLLVPVGGAIVAGFDKEIVENVARTYVGRASSSQSLDVLMTLLSLGLSGYQKLLFERKSLFLYLKESLKELSAKYNEIIYETKNPISLGMTLQNLCKNSQKDECTKLGSMLFTRGVSGTRIITTLEQKIINGYKFNGWGSHQNESKIPYLTVAVSLGTKKIEIEEFIGKLDKCLVKFLKKNEIK